jgi:hypothetical protein
MAALAVVVATAVLIVAGVASGFVIGTAPIPGQQNQAGLAAQFATAQWAGVFPALLLVGAIAACWWQQQVWGGPAEAEHRPAEAARRLERARRLALSANAGLGLAVLGAVASFIGRAADPGGTGAQAVGSSYIPGAAELLATIVVAAAGTSITLRLARGYLPDEPPDAG